MPDAPERFAAVGPLAGSGNWKHRTPRGEEGRAPFPEVGVGARNDGMMVVTAAGR